jgi:hypothetical protein
MWRWGVWHVSPDGDWWAPCEAGKCLTWRQAFNAALAAVLEHHEGDVKASVRKVVS